MDPGADTWTGEVHYGRGGAFEPLAIADGRFALALDYPDDGVNYTVTVRLYDDDGGASTGAFVVTAENVAPAVAPPEDVQLVEGAPFVTLVPFTDPGADAWTALVSYGDGSGLVELPVDAAARAVPLAHAWPDDGTFVVFVQVTDDGGASDGESFLAAVANAAPAPNAGGDVIVPEGTAFSRDAVALDPGAGDALTGVVRWGVGEADETLAIDPLTRGYRLERRWEDEGTHEVAVTVRDDDDGVATEVFTVAVANVAPAVDCGSPAVLAVGEAFVRGCAFTDPGADAWTASVDWGDGGEPEALEVGPGGALALEHTFAAEGTFAVTVAVDDGTEVGRASLEVAVGNAPPLVALGGPAVADEGAAFVRAGQAFDAGPGPFAAVVDWGDGGEAEALALDEALAFELSHVYADEGVYTVSVEVTDGDAETGTGQVAVTVRNVAPTVVAGGDAALAEGGRLVRTVGASDPGVNDALTATVDYGDGGGAVALGAGPPWTLDHVYGQDGAYAVVVAVSDGDGGVGEGRFTAQVANGAPVVSAGGPGAATEGAAFTREVTFSDAGADTWTAMAKASSLTLRVLMPQAFAAISSSRIATQARPMRESSRRMETKTTSRVSARNR